MTTTYINHSVILIMGTYLRRSRWAGHVARHLILASFFQFLFKTVSGLQRLHSVEWEDALNDESQRNGGGVI